MAARGMLVSRGVIVECGFSCRSVWAFVCLYSMESLSPRVTTGDSLAEGVVCVSCCVWSQLVSGVSGPWDKGAQQVGLPLSDFLWPLKKRISRGKATPALPLQISSQGAQAWVMNAAVGGPQAGEEGQEEAIRRRPPLLPSHLQRARPFSTN